MRRPRENDPLRFDEPAAAREWLDLLVSGLVLVCVAGTLLGLSYWFLLGNR